MLSQSCRTQLVSWLVKQVQQTVVLEDSANCTFTKKSVLMALYGIEAIATQLEEPFGWDKADIKMDDVVEDLRIEVGVLLREWQANATMFGRQDQESLG